MFLKLLKIKFILLAALYFFLPSNLFSQSDVYENYYKFVLDSINDNIESLKLQINEKEKTRDVSYYNLQRNLDLATFQYEYYSFLIEDDFKNAEELTAKCLNMAEIRKDNVSIDFFKEYRDKSSW